jgi:tRNA threonylcarbamoyladenosine biosynthesis protein TsaB
MSKDFIIAIETSGRAGSAAVCTPEGEILEMPFSGMMKHSAELFPTLHTLLDKAEGRPDNVGEVYITSGPGSFTGLRIAVTAAKMFHFAQQVRIVSADTMDVIAENAVHEKSVDCIATVLDAKKGYFYAAVYDRTKTGWDKSFGTKMVRAEDLLGWLQTNNRNPVGLLGEGLLYYADQFKTPFTRILDESLWTARAAKLIRVGQRMAAAGQYTDPVTLTPTYIGLPDAVTVRQRKKR